MAMNTIAAGTGALLASLFPCLAAAMAQGKPAGEPVIVRFWGHACFTITAHGKTLLIDPYSPKKVGYPAFDVAPEVVVITHEHFDHADTSWVRGGPLVLHGLDKAGTVQSIDRTVGPFHVRAVAAQHWHDAALRARGNVAIFVIEVDGLKIVHVGDLGEKLDAAQTKAIGTPDVLMVPVGGFFTVDADQAYQVVQQLKPRAYVIPMHYRTTALETSLRSQLAEPGAFLRKFGDQVVRLDGNELRIDPAALPPTMKAVLMDYRPAPAGTQPGAAPQAGGGSGK
jgi:L-ascorbate metabolism protein UlaG (beta-lactamase superfamily)